MSKNSKLDLLFSAGDLAKRLVSSRGGDLKAISKDLVDGVLVKAGQQKDIVVDAMANEFSKFLQRINVSEELQNILKDLTIDVDARIELSKRSSGSTLAKLNRKIQFSSSKAKKQIKKEKRNFKK